MMRTWSAFLVLGMSSLAAAQSVPSGFTVESYGGTLAGGTTLAWTPDGRLLVGQLNGAVLVIRNGLQQAAPFHTATVDSGPGSERGLLGLCVDPDFASNGYVYLYFTTPSPASHNCVRRIRASAPGSDVSDGTETPIVDLENLGADLMHNGGSLLFGGDGKLYVAVGDNMIPGMAQSLSSRLGKILRYNPDGSIPTDNPTTFEGISGSPTGEFRALWAVGLRNPFRIAIQPGSMRLFINDVGLDNWEEIDDGMAGKNYGWEGAATDGARGLPGFTDPIFQYGHSGTVPTGVAITGGAFYNPPVAQYPPAYAGRYFFTDFGSGFIQTLDPAAPGTSQPFLTGASGPVDLQVGPDGSLYYLQRLGTPGVYRVVYGSAVPPVAGSPVAGTGASAGGSGGGSCGATGVEPLLLIPLLGRLRRRVR